MEAYYEEDSVQLFLGDSLDVLPTLPDASIDAVVCDPPYALAELPAKLVTEALTAWLSGDRAYTPAGPGGFMGRDWDRFVPPPAVWDECLRVLKPGAHLAVFSGARTVDLMGLSMRLAGAEIRDSIDWIYGSGMPKGKQQLKPAHEPIILARKPLDGTLTATIHRHGTGALNVDGCRIPAGQDYRDKCASVVGLTSPRTVDSYGEWTGIRTDSTHNAGRWPTNIILSHGPDCADGGECQLGCPVAEMDQQSGIREGGHHPKRGGRMGYHGAAGYSDGSDARDIPGGASRFFPVFRYEAKAPASERPRLPDGTAHTTVKPLALMRWLVRLITPPGGTVLDPFTGSGTTLEACRLENFQSIGIEMDAAHAELCRIRLGKPYMVDLFGGGAA